MVGKNQLFKKYFAQIGPVPSQFVHELCEYAYSEGWSIEGINSAGFQRVAPQISVVQSVSQDQETVYPMSSVVISKEAPVNEPPKLASKEFKFGL